MKRLLALVIVVLAAPCVQAGAPVNTIGTDSLPPYLLPSSGAPVEVGFSANEVVVLSKVAGAASVISLISLAPGSDFQLNGGTCVQGVTTLVNPGDSCTINLQFAPTVAGPRAGTLNVDCTPIAAPGGLVINCDINAQTIANIALRGLGALLASVPVPLLGRYELTGLALLLFALALGSLRRKP